MHYVTVEGLTKSFGINPLFNNISFHINEGDKIALVARNGVGKSTLLRILSGQETADEGTVWINKDVTVALFEQDPKFDENKTILDNIFHTENPVLKVIREYEAAVEADDGHAISDALSTMDELDAWTFEAKVKEILTKLNIHNLQQPVNNLSGGQRKRVALAQTLIDIGFEHQHTLLIMDEPTNHLDVEMVEWLEHYLNGEHVTLLMVTHDRYFLDAVCDEIWEMDRSEIHSYKGDYANYLEKKTARIESELSTIDKAKNTYRKELEWMRKQPKARTTKSKSRQDNFYEVEVIAKKKIEDAQLQLNVKMSRLGGKIAEFKKVNKAYGDKTIMRGFDYTFSKGERIGVIGKNGVGKSTFLNILQGIEKPDSGKINIGETVIFGNFSQQGLEFKDDMRIIEYVKTFAESFPLAKGGSISASQFLELFLFPGDKQYTYLSSLSGGEKKRLQLLVILFRNPNFLILDEPTNDLDLPTLGVLENFLVDFQGCLLIVSHDRYFMDRLVDHLFVFEGDGEIRDFPGNYTLYREWIKTNEKKANKWDALTDKKNKGETTEAVAGMEQNKPLVAAAATTLKKANFKEKREFEMLEKEIAELEAEKQQVEQNLSNPEAPFEQLNLLSKRIGEIDNALAQKEMRWLELSELM
ncbi:ABC transporter ATP-binding protein [Segetibacter sp. 3557_3]|uniref:ABC-F family ATP-binding cassette domain-containing protein n=1 Tax=Segetibacter sp. 3557_3 TaxID=2547429 RepID=UPI001058E271|nr:ABC-F family ATP-binding cassette domain-containing protein [Segetibacter sp. 3557_3]TDH20052.1 ABC transporter ATP-binding protein [Segetibacter sp. 3557_3]